MQGITMSIDKLEPFSGDASPENGYNLSIDIVIPYICVQINFCSYVGIT